MIKHIISNILLCIALFLYCFTYSSLVGTVYFIFGLLIFKFTFDNGFSVDRSKIRTLQGYVIILIIFILYTSPKRIEDKNKKLF